LAGSQKIVPQTNPTPPAGAQTIIRSDTVWNYEAGLKGKALDGALAFDISIYHIDWNDIQLNTLANGIVLGGNAAAATVDGFELELTLRPSDLLTVGVNAGHTDAKIKDISAGAAAVSGARAGNKLPLTPPWTVALIADHRLPISPDISGNIGVTLRHQSKAPATYPALDPTPTQTLPDITTLDLRASATFGERYTLQARVDNALNQFSFTNIDAAGNAVALRPRTFTLGFGVEF
jgi:outer membrane receptor protein involved in Fe transport